MDKQFKNLIITFIIAILIFKLVFYKESFITIIRIVAIFFWIFVLPGFIFLFNYKLNFVEKLVISIAISTALIGITSYYLGLLGLNIKHHWILPLIYLIIGFLIKNVKR